MALVAKAGTLLLAAFLSAGAQADVNPSLAQSRDMAARLQPGADERSVLRGFERSPKADGDRRPALLPVIRVVLSSLNGRPFGRSADP